VGPLLCFFTDFEPPDGFFGSGGDLTFSFFLLPRSFAVAMLERFLEVSLDATGGADPWTASAQDGVPLRALRPPLPRDKALVDGATVNELDELPCTESANIRVGSLEEEEEEEDEETGP
jgi:hypothetical protein